ncbi:A/G-specific adenine glycosylase [Aeromicrobium camelliae]|uniref:Adenine DNA glycosylase n=1 Tax=Aeromicrobium camelliae TaxID=1538144 RepID=A0A3N6WJY6_9ACTN|nr:A/G-specific adenine glycosylase [Aeromicrobium camelliae]RQN02095.1 A/G-specific adenine glycosylase [Aeromicrobium camelliae]
MDPQLSSLHDDVLAWFGEHRRDLPWRGRDGERPDPWSVLVSEFMLQQTPVARVLPVFDAWMATWPTPADLAAATAGDAVRAWGRLGYPRRALRLHAAATAIAHQHAGRVPDTYEALRELPGVGDYTAAAIASFAYGRRVLVLDTNVRRVFTRVVRGEQYPTRSVTAAERRLGQELMPADRADEWAAATMELGALVCTARAPRCAACPIADRCAWRAAGYPQGEQPKGQTWHGTDRQVRGRLMAVLRESHAPVPKAALDAVWDDATQRDRCLAGLLDDGLVELVDDDVFALPGHDEGR